MSDVRETETTSYLEFADVRRELERLAVREGLRLSDIIRRATRQFVERQEQAPTQPKTTQSQN